MECSNGRFLYNSRKAPSAPLLALSVNKRLNVICHIHVIQSAFPEFPDNYITGM